MSLEITPELIDKLKDTVLENSDSLAISNGIFDGIVGIAQLASSAFEGAKTILGYIGDFITTFTPFAELLPAPVTGIAISILSVMATVITFKVVGYFT